MRSNGDLVGDRLILVNNRFLSIRIDRSLSNRLLFPWMEINSYKTSSKFNTIELIFPHHGLCHKNAEPHLKCPFEYVIHRHKFALTGFMTKSFISTTEKKKWCRQIKWRLTIWKSLCRRFSRTQNKPKKITNKIKSITRTTAKSQSMR